MMFYAGPRSIKPCSFRTVRIRSLCLAHTPATDLDLDFPLIDPPLIKPPDGPKGPKSVLFSLFRNFFYQNGGQISLNETTEPHKHDDT